LVIREQTLNEIALKHNVTRQTLDNWFAPFRKKEILLKYVNSQGRVLISDGYFVRWNACVLIVILTNGQPITWLFTQRENYHTWFTCFNQIEDTPLALVVDGKAGSIKAAKARWPKIIIQRCQFHVIHYVSLILTKHPETSAARSFKSLVGKITMVKTTDEWKMWVTNLKDWYLLYGDFLTMRTYQNDNFTSTGRW
jgi:hypothetical protein